MSEIGVKGFWKWTWKEDTVPSDSTLSVAFSGWVEPDTALQESAKIKNQLVGESYISLGGGNENGRFTSSKIDTIIAAINSGKFSGYQGIAFDIEEGDTGLNSRFQEAFVASKNNNLKVLVTISHTAPYGISDAQQLMAAFFADKNIDYLSPQLYTQGTETQNDFTENMGVKWADYANTNAAIIPSIVQANLYQNAKDYFQKIGLNTKGFIQWSQTSSTPIPSPIPSPPTPTPTPSPTSNSTWNINKHYNVGDLVTYNSKQYKCLQEHDSVDPNWTPPNTPALWQPL
ncbi:carbohydrate-binding protein [Nostoc sp.]|uniref:carbohydrate-binding protein n=1 Tax=Nostoc sp. TaxID=1180 RepID=UPI002FF48899